YRSGYLFGQKIQFGLLNKMKFISVYFSLYQFNSLLVSQLVQTGLERLAERSLEEGLVGARLDAAQEPIDLVPGVGHRARVRVGSGLAQRVDHRAHNPTLNGPFGPLLAQVTDHRGDVGLVAAEEPPRHLA